MDPKQSQNVSEFKFEIGKIAEGVSSDDYNKWPGVRSSWLQPMMRSQAHFLAHLLEPREELEHFVDGNNIHAILENGHKFLSRLIVEPIFEGPTLDGKMSTRSKAAIQKRQDWLNSIPADKIVLTIEKQNMLTGIVNSMGQHSFVRKVIKEGLREAAVVVKDPESGLYLKCKPDLITNVGHIVDFKSTTDANTFQREIFSPYGRFYILQAAFYNYCLSIAGVRSAATQQKFMFIAIEKSAPWGIKVFPLGDQHLEIGMVWVRKLLQDTRESFETDTYRSYPEIPVSVEVPAYPHVPIDESLYQ